ncbi:MAG: hypothetical protein H7A33_02745 [Deltaproteobacteria bacterium]|nr:hypothetical protein [Deltaproteobacteria bacterium]
MQELVIIGAGYAGLAAFAAATQAGQSPILIAKDFGGSRFFSGAFDVLDPAFQLGSFQVSQTPSTKELLSQFIRVHPQHLYAKFGAADFDFVNRAKEFCSFYHLPAVFEDNMIACFGSSGKAKWSAGAMAGQGLRQSELAEIKKVVLVNVSALTDYPAGLIAKNLKKQFNDVTVLTVDLGALNATAPLAHVNQLMDAGDLFEKLCGALAGVAGSNAVIMMPPILGVRSFQKHHQELRERFSAKTLELLSVLPSISGERAHQFILKKLAEFPKRFVQQEILSVECADNVFNLKLSDQQIEAKKVILATGKFVGGGVRREGRFFETLFDLPLIDAQQVPVKGKTMIQLSHARAEQNQDFMGVGVNWEQSPSALQPCGHVLGGFDFAREKCGFGISLISAHKSLN